MQTYSQGNDAHHTLLRLKIRTTALGHAVTDPNSESVQEFCNRLNRLKEKSDQELNKIGIKRSEIGAHVLHGLLN